MRILHVTQPTTEGVAQVVASLCNFQAEAGHDVLLARPTAPPMRGVTDAVRTIDWNGVRRPIPTRGELRVLRDSVARERPDVIHLHSSKAGLCGRLVVRGRVPTLFQPHGWSFLVGGTVGNTAQLWERLAARWTTMFLLLGDDEARLAQRARVPATKARNVRNGVDTDRFRPNRQGGDALRSWLGLPDGHLLVVAVGRRDAAKGFDRLADMWRMVHPHLEGMLVLIGTDLDEYATEPGMRSIGEQSNVMEWLSAADLCVVPSRYEGQPLVVLEAMASGTPIVAFDCFGVTSLLEGFGRIVPQGDIASLATAVIELAADPAVRATYADCGRQRVLDRFRQEAALSEVTRLTELAAGGAM